MLYTQIYTSRYICRDKRNVYMTSRPSIRPLHSLLYQTERPSSMLRHFCIKSSKFKLNNIMAATITVLDNKQMCQVDLSNSRNTLMKMWNHISKLYRYTVVCICIQTTGAATPSAPTRREARRMAYVGLLCEWRMKLACNFFVVLYSKNIKAFRHLKSESIISDEKNYFHE